MNELSNFLDSSTIHGLSYISSNKKYSKVFWTLIVLGGFSGAFILIQESFYNWEQSPITTTIESFPISQITFPNVTVCPPRNTYLDLNYDLMKADDLDLDATTREDLLEFAKQTVHDSYFDEFMTNLSKLQDDDRSYNWYNGYTKIQYPLYYFDYHMHGM